MSISFREFAALRTSWISWRFMFVHAMSCMYFTCLRRCEWAVMVVASGWSWLMSWSSVFVDLKMSAESWKSQGKVREIRHLPPVATLFYSQGLSSLWSLSTLMLSKAVDEMGNNSAASDMPWAFTNFFFSVEAFARLPRHFIGLITVLVWCFPFSFCCNSLVLCSKAECYFMNSMQTCNSVTYFRHVYFMKKLIFWY